MQFTSPVSEAAYIPRIRCSLHIQYQMQFRSLLPDEIYISNIKMQLKYTVLNAVYILSIKYSLHFHYQILFDLQYQMQLRYPASSTSYTKIIK